jgi:hypothetical protein
MDGIRGCKISNPLFVHAQDGNYRLQSVSPGVRSGIVQAWMSGATDLEGNRRTSGSGVDMGCYQTPPPNGTLFFFR